MQKAVSVYCVSLMLLEDRMCSVQIFNAVCTVLGPLKCFMLYIYIYTVVSVFTVLLNLPFSVLKCVWRQMSVSIIGRWSVITVTASFPALPSLYPHLQRVTLYTSPSSSSSSSSATLKSLSAFQAASAAFEQRYCLMFCPHSFISLDGMWCGDYMVEWQVALSSDSSFSFDLKAFLAMSDERLKKQLPFLVQSLHA